MKAQVGIETLMIATILILLLVFSLISYVNRNNEISSVKEYLEAKKICRNVQNTINQLASNSYGASVKLTIPDKLETLNYSLSVYAQDKLILISWKNTSTSCSLLTQNVTNATGYVFSQFSINKGDNQAFVDGDGTIVIKKI